MVVAIESFADTKVEILKLKEEVNVSDIHLFVERINQNKQDCVSIY